MNKLLDKKIDSLSYEDAFERLQQITQLLEDGNVTLDDSIKYYEQGVLLKNFCEKKLKDAEMKIKTVLDNKENKDKE
ncbi:MAG: exodeoxyribonuclease VII small subunit [Alphaproteobacteria bacterium]